MASGSIKARVQCMIEIPVGTWGGGKSVDMDALTEQVRREGRQIVERIINEKQGVVIGVPRVLFVTLQEDQ